MFSLGIDPVQKPRPNFALGLQSLLAKGYILALRTTKQVSIGVLFWQFANDVVPVAQAKRFYPLFGQMSSLAPVVAGLCVVRCTSALSSGGKEGKALTEGLLNFVVVRRTCLFLDNPCLSILLYCCIVYGVGLLLSTCLPALPPALLVWCLSALCFLCCVFFWGGGCAPPGWSAPCCSGAEPALSCWRRLPAMNGLVLIRVCWCYHLFLPARTCLGGV